MHRCDGKIAAGSSREKGRCYREPSCKYARTIVLVNRARRRRRKVPRIFAEEAVINAQYAVELMAEELESATVASTRKGGSIGNSSYS